MFLHAWLILVGCSTKVKLWVVLEITLDQRSLVIGLHLKSGLLTPQNHNTFVAGSSWLSNFGPFQRPPLSFFPQGRVTKEILKDINTHLVGLGNTWILIASAQNTYGHCLGCFFMQEGII